MYSLHCTKKLLDRIKPSIAFSLPAPTTALGNWYATALFWKPQLALFVNERTLLPVLMPFAPASTLVARFPNGLAAVLSMYGASGTFIGREVAAMTDVTLAKTANRSVVGIMNEFSFLAEGYRGYLETSDLMTLTMRLADTPCGPIEYNSPARRIEKMVGDAVR